MSSSHSLIGTTDISHNSNEVQTTPIDFDFESTIFQALVNEGKYIKVLNSRRSQFSFNEKELRDAAHAEVAKITAQEEVEASTSSRKRKMGFDGDDKSTFSSKDRNREHAKNTRLRKKCYVKKLKELVDRMHAQKDLEDRERKALGQRIHDTQTTRKNMVRLMLSNRAQNVADRARWSCVLDEHVTMTLPVTPYRNFDVGQIYGAHRVVRGIDAVMADSCSLSMMAETLGQGSPEWIEATKRGQSCRVVYSAGVDDMMAAGDLVVCRYLMRIEGWEKVGAACGTVQQGMMQFRFESHSHKIVAVEIVFDVLGFMQQLQRASHNAAETMVTHSTLDRALRMIGDSPNAVAVVSCSEPYLVTAGSVKWAALTQYIAPGEQQQLLLSLRAHEFQNEMLLKLFADASCGRAGSAVYLAYSAPPQLLDSDATPNCNSCASTDGVAARTTDSAPKVLYVRASPLYAARSAAAGESLSSAGDSASCCARTTPSGLVSRVSHMLVELVDLPLTSQEVDALLADRLDDHLSSCVAAQQYADSLQNNSSMADPAPTDYSGFLSDRAVGSSQSGQRPSISNDRKFSDSSSNSSGGSSFSGSTVDSHSERDQDDDDDDNDDDDHDDHDEDDDSDGGLSGEISSGAEEEEEERSGSGNGHEKKDSSSSVFREGKAANIGDARCTRNSRR